MKPLDSFIEHRPFVEALARRLVDDVNEADDVVQETWKVALERPPRRNDNLKGWLGTVVRSQVISRGRMRHSRAHHEASRPPLRDAPAPEDVLAGQRIREQLAAAIAGLTSSQREVIGLRFLDALPPREIAARLDLPIETVRTRIKRALAQLRSRLDREYGGERGAWTLALGRWLHWEQTTSTLAGSLGLGSVSLALLALMPILGLVAWGLLGQRGSRVLPIAPPDLVALDKGTTPDGLSAEPGPLQARDTLDRDDAPTDQAQTGNLRIHLRWERSNEPASGVRVRLRPVAAGGEMGLELSSDEMGFLNPTDLAPGAWTLATESAPPMRAMVRAGETSTLRWSLSRGVRSRGIVRFLSGEPCPGATVLASLPGEPQTVRQVAVSASNGEFETTPLDDDCWIGARLGDGQTTLTHLRRRRRERSQALELFLPRQTDRRMTLTVLGAGGRPVEKARVEVESRTAGLTRFGLGGNLVRTSAPECYLTDAQGLLSLASLEASPTTIRIRAPGYAPALLQRPRDAESDARVAIRLDAEAAVEGFVSDGRGRAVVAARVVADLGAAFGRLHAVTDRHGRFRLGDLPAGSIELEVHAEFRTEQAGWARATRIVRAGETIQWDAEVSSDAVVRARLLLADGTAASGWWAALHSVDEDQPGIQRLFRRTDSARDKATDTDGRVVFSAGPGTYALRFWPTDGRAGAPQAWIAGVQPGDREFIVRPSGDEDGEGASLSGFLVDADGAPVGDAQVLLISPLLDEAIRLPVEPGSGYFHASDLPRTRYELGVWPATVPPTFGLHSIDMGGGTLSMLDPIVAPAPATLRVRILGPSGQAHTDPGQVLLTGDDLVAVSRGVASPSGFVLADGALEFPALRAGRYDLRISSLGYAPIVEALDLLAGDETALDLQLDWAGNAAYFLASIPHASSAEAELDLTIRNAAGAVVRTQRIQLPPRLKGVPFSVGSLGAGNYTAHVKIQAHDGAPLRGSTGFQLPSLSTKAERIDIALGSESSSLAGE